MVALSYLFEFYFRENIFCTPRFCNFSTHYLSELVILTNAVIIHISGNM